MSAKTSSATEPSLKFLPVSLDTVEFMPDNAWDFLASSPSLLPADTESLVVDFTIQLEKSAPHSGRGGKRATFEPLAAGELSQSFQS